MKLSRRGLLAGVLGLPLVAALGKTKTESRIYSVNMDGSDLRFVGRIDTSSGVLCNFGATYSDTFSANWSTLDTSYSGKLTCTRNDHTHEAVT